MDIVNDLTKWLCPKCRRIALMYRRSFMSIDGLDNKTEEVVENARLSCGTLVVIILQKREYRPHGWRWRWRCLKINDGKHAFRLEGGTGTRSSICISGQRLYRSGM